jgi:PPP family 3-phenylpropionic acid transporter
MQTSRPEEAAYLEVQYANGRGAVTFMLRLSLFYGALFTLYGTQVPYLPVWLDWRGFTAAEIGLLTSAPMFVRVAVTPAVAFGADRLGDHRRVVLVLSWISLIAAAALGQVHGFLPVLLLVGVLLIAMTTVMPLTETIAMAGVQRLGVDYGRMRLWGSLTFIGASFGGGVLLDARAPSAVMALLVAAAAAILVAAYLLPGPGQAEPRARARRPPLRLASASALARSRSFQLFVLAASTVQASHAVFYAFGVLDWRAQGLASGTTGALWAISIAAEVALFAASGWFVARLGAVGLLAGGAAAGVVRWLAMAFDPPLVALVPLQLLHALSFGATHLGAMHHIERSVASEQAGTAQALYATASGLAMGGATLVAGALYGTIAGRSYLAMAALAGAGLAACLALRRRSV